MKISWILAAKINLKSLPKLSSYVLGIKEYASYQLNAAI